MNNLNDLKNKAEALKNTFNTLHADLVVSRKMSVSDFKELTLELVQAIAVLEKAIKELSNGMYTFNSNGTVSVKHLSHFRNGRYHHDLEYKTVDFSFIDCLRNLKYLNINKYLLLKAVTCDDLFYNEKDFVEITAEVAEEIKNTLSAYEAELVTVKAYLSTGLSGFDYNGAIAKKAHLEMMVANYAKMVELLPTFVADEDEKTGVALSKLFKKDSVPFLKVLHKLTDKRFSFNIVHGFTSGVQGYNLEMSFMGDFVASCSIPDFHITTALDCLIDLINYADKQNHSDYFDKFGVSFEIYHCKNLNGKNYYSFRKNDSAKWVKISDKVASYILEQNDIVINGLYDSVVSYCQYDCYYNINLKSE